MASKDEAANLLRLKRCVRSLEFTGGGGVSITVLDLQGFWIAALELCDGSLPD